ncbi:Rha family transcriptional regulator [Cereibacter sphaeroides]|uniref:Rha family transcriptional regulator n=1 Tax=Cereibacter sphaeroides TaxID=1063 RepID=UPI001F277151|nr:Rha family transcriptional regulator [Cereibacter sphaeroides]
MTNSRDVAEYFGKAHRHVLESIRELDDQLSAKGSAVRFVPVFLEQKTGFGVRKVPAYNMSRDAFTLLTMGYQGTKALDFKLRYIAQFNAMEAALKAPAPPLRPILDGKRSGQGRLRRLPRSGLCRKILLHCSEDEGLQAA